MVPPGREDPATGGDNPIPETRGGGGGGAVRESATRPTRGVGVPVSASGGAWLERLTVTILDVLA